MLKITVKMPRTLAPIAREINEDIAAIREQDPAARSGVSPLEVLVLYSGLHAVLAYRVAHRVYVAGHKFPARLISQLARFLTGVEIHPAARIGRALFIDHGAGIVIGETAEVGDHCTIYQGATLGGTGKETGKRHPTLGSNVMVGAGAKLLGGFRVGDGAKIAAGAVVLGEVPAGATAVGIPAKVVRQDGVRTGARDSDCPDLDQTHIPDPVERELSALRARVEAMEKELRKGERARASE